MKRGDTLPVIVGGLHIGNAVVEAIDLDEAVIFVPAIRVKVKVNTSIAAHEGEGSTVILDD